MFGVFVYRCVLCAVVYVYDWITDDDNYFDNDR